MDSSGDASCGLQVPSGKFCSKGAILARVRNDKCRCRHAQMAGAATYPHGPRACHVHVSCGEALGGRGHMDTLASEDKQQQGLGLFKSRRTARPAPAKILRLRASRSHAAKWSQRKAAYKSH